MSRTACPIVLSPDERTQLERIVRARTSSTERLAGLRDRPHCPPPRRYGAAQQAAIVVLACQAPPARGWEGQTHWSIADLTQYIQAHPELGLGAPSKSTVGRILRAHDLRLDRL